MMMFLSHFLSGYLDFVIFNINKISFIDMNILQVCPKKQYKDGHFENNMT